jgi:hypothetical protein
VRSRCSRAPPPPVTHATVVLPRRSLDSLWRQQPTHRHTIERQVSATQQPRRDAPPQAANGRSQPHIPEAARAQGRRRSAPDARRAQPARAWRHMARRGEAWVRRGRGMGEAWARRGRGVAAHGAAWARRGRGMVRTERRFRCHDTSTARRAQTSLEVLGALDAAVGNDRDTHTLLDCADGRPIDSTRALLHALHTQTYTHVHTRTRTHARTRMRRGDADEQQDVGWDGVQCGRAQ